MRESSPRSKMKTHCSSLTITSLFTIVLLTAPVEVVAQSFVGWGFKLGLTTANQSQVLGNVTLDLDSRSGLDLGAFAEWIESPWFSVNSEISFVQKGWEEEIPVTTTEFPNGTGQVLTQSVRLNYLSLAVLPKIRLPVGPLQLYALIGPRIDVAIGHSVELGGYSEPARSYLQRQWDWELDHYRDALVGGDFAVGFSTHALLPLGLGAEVRYSPDFTAAHAGENFSAKNSSWEFLVVISM